MELEFKPDFENARKAWQSFWDGTNKRPMILASCPKPGSKPVDCPKYLACFDGDMHAIADQVIRWASNREFLGDAIPFYYLEFGPDTFGAYLGAGLKLSDDRSTSWAVPFVSDWDEVEIKFHKDGYWWKRTVEAIEILRNKCDGKLLICPPTLVANLDALAAIRGAESLLMDLVVCPDKVKTALRSVCCTHTEVMNALATALDFPVYGSVNIEGAYTTGRQSRPQCDISCMISPDMFREFVVPCLLSEANDADAFVYHLDGPGAVHHVDALCGIQKLDVIQWVPGAGQEQTDWTPLFERFDSLGKGHGRWIGDHENIVNVWSQYRSKKLIFNTHANSKAEMDDLLERLEKTKK